jgi:hypothetical protein
VIGRQIRVSAEQFREDTQLEKRFEWKGAGERAAQNGLSSHGEVAL